MVNLQILDVASLAYMPSFVSFKLNYTGTVLCSNFLGKMLICWINTLILAKCLCFVAASYASFFTLVYLHYSPATYRSCWCDVSVGGLGPCSEQCLPENQAKWMNFYMVLHCRKFQSQEALRLLVLFISENYFTTCKQIPKLCPPSCV